jgi:hypothetical protein
MSGKIEEGEGPKVIDLKEAPVMTDAEIARQRKLQQKQAASELADYKKRIRASNELKQLQVDELRLNLEYYKYRKELKDLAPEMEEFEALMEAEQKEFQERQRKEYEEYISQQKKKEEEKEKKPEIIQPKIGKPRK